MDRFFNRISEIAPFQIRKPIFIVAPPRSGSTMLFECLNQFKELYSLPHECDQIWWEYFPYDRTIQPSDYISVKEIDNNVIKQIKKKIYLGSVITHSKRYNYRLEWLKKLGFGPIRYLDKTIANCFHLDVINIMFPEAKYLILLRDPRDNISSMIEGWSQSHRFGKPQLTYIIKSCKNSTIKSWSYPAPPGWINLINRSLPEICAWSWKKHIESMMNFMDAEKIDSKTILYEKFIDNPYYTIKELASWLDLTLSDSVQNYLRNIPWSDTTVSIPKKEKWKDINHDEINSIIPLIKKVARQIGYEI